MDQYIVIQQTDDDSSSLGDVFGPYDTYQKARQSARFLGSFDKKSKFVIRAISDTITWIQDFQGFPRI